VITIGILGGGSISDTHARAAHAIPGVEIGAVCGTNPEKVRSLAQTYGAAQYDDVERFLEHRPLDIVAIGSPSGLHAEQTIAAIRHGLHVLVEKPLDVTTAKVDAVIEEADRHSVKVGVFCQDRLKPDVLALRSMIESGRMGTPVMAAGRVRWFRPPEYYAASRWRGTWALDGGGALINQAIHTVDLLQWLYGPVAQVCARTATRVQPIEVEDTAAAVLQFTSGALGTIEAATSIYPGYARRIEITGSEGTVILEGDRLVRVDLRNSGMQASDGPLVSEAAPSAAVHDTHAHQRLFEDFIDAIQTDRAPICDAREGRHSVAIVEAIYRSARTGSFQQP
jgi:UDP-N-acetyl-2-amino-2-deoxyglucuronate dehydrogenase